MKKWLSRSFLLFSPASPVLPVEQICTVTRRRLGILFPVFRMPLLFSGLLLFRDYISSFGSSFPPRPKITFPVFRAWCTPNPRRNRFCSLRPSFLRASVFRNSLFAPPPDFPPLNRRLPSRWPPDAVPLRNLIATLPLLGEFLRLPRAFLFSMMFILAAGSLGGRLFSVCIFLCKGFRVFPLNSLGRNNPSSAAVSGSCSGLSLLLAQRAFFLRLFK